VLARSVHVDGEQSRSGVEDLLVSGCQADQLAVAVRSPVTSHEHQGRRSVEVFRQGPRATRLVDDGEISNGHR
jgi:hypothetical protein